MYAFPVSASITLDMDHLMERALALPSELRELVAYRLWESLFPGEEVDLSPEQTAELDRRIDDLEAGRTGLLDGDQVMAELRARATSAVR